MRLLVMTNHPSEDASSRQRVYEYIPHLTAAGIQATVEPFTNQRLYSLLRQPGKGATKTWLMVMRTLRRLRTVISIPRYDVVLIHREAFPFGPPILEEIAIRWARAVVYSFDDALYAEHAAGVSRRERLLYRLKYRRDLRRVLAKAQAVVAGSHVLAEYARRYSGAVVMIPTSVEMSRYAIAARPATDDVVLGWVGSHSTSQYLQGIAPALRVICSEYANVRILCVGDPCLQLGVERVRVKAWRYEDEAADLAQIDIGLMPMPDTEWTRGKCAYKAIQYMAAGKPVVASPVGAANDVIAHGITGFLASTTSEWIMYLRRLVNDANERVVMGARGREVVAKSYSIERTAPSLVAVLSKSVASTEAVTRRRQGG